MTPLPEHVPQWFAQDIARPLHDFGDGLWGNEELPSRNDSHGYYVGDFPDGCRISAGQSHVYITGGVSANVSVSGRPGAMVCAKTIDPTVTVKGCGLLVVGDTCSADAIQRVSSQTETPILVVPEAARADVFDCLAKNEFRAMGMDHALKALVDTYPNLAMSAYHFGEAAGLPESGNPSATVTGVASSHHPRANREKKR